MKSRRQVSAICGIVAVAAVAAGCSAAAEEPSAEPSEDTSSEAPEDGDDPAGPPLSATFDFGEFTLADRIADKLSAEEPLEIVLSFQTVAQVGAPALMAAGMERAAAEVLEEYGVQMNTRVIGPASTDPTTQISQIDQAVGSGQVDCLAVQPVTPDAFASVINSAVESGVPTYTVNTDSADSHRFAYYGPNDTDLDASGHLGIIAGEETVRWAEANDVTIEKAALVTGDTTAPWAQGRMEGWVQAITEAFPDVEIVGSPTNALTTGYDAAKTYADVGAFMNGNPDVDFYFDTDWGGQAIGKLIEDRGLRGDVAAIGYNLDGNYLEQVRRGNIIATVDQAFDKQAAAFVKGCADFLLGGEQPSGGLEYVPPTVVTKENVEEIAEQFASMGGE